MSLGPYYKVSTESSDIQACQQLLNDGGNVSYKCKHLCLLSYCPLIRLSSPVPGSSLTSVATISIVCASAAAPRLHPLQLLLPDCINYSQILSTSASAPRPRPIWRLLPDCVRFHCCSLIASASSPVVPT